jgi:hypothetical protein
MQDDNSKDADAAFAARTLAVLPAITPAPALEARILAQFDAVAARRARTPWAATTRTMRRFGDAIWPGVPVWQPASILALSLLIGLAAGTLVPAWSGTNETSGQSLSLDVPPVLDTSGES